MTTGTFTTNLTQAIIDRLQFSQSETVDSLLGTLQEEFNEAVKIEIDRLLEIGTIVKTQDDQEIDECEIQLA